MVEEVDPVEDEDPTGTESASAWRQPQGHLTGTSGADLRNWDEVVGI